MSIGSFPSGGGSSPQFALPPQVNMNFLRSPTPAPTPAQPGQPAEQYPNLMQNPAFNPAAFNPEQGLFNARAQTPVGVNPPAQAPGMLNNLNDMVQIRTAVLVPGPDGKLVHPNDLQSRYPDYDFSGPVPILRQTQQPAGMLPPGGNPQVIGGYTPPLPIGGPPTPSGILDPRDAAGENQRAEAVKSYYNTRQQIANQQGLRDGTPEYTNFLLNYQQTNPVPTYTNQYPNLMQNPAFNPAAPLFGGSEEQLAARGIGTPIPTPPTTAQQIASPAPGVQQLIDQLTPPPPQPALSQPPQMAAPLPTPQPVTQPALTGDALKQSLGLLTPAGPAPAPAPLAQPVAQPRANPFAQNVIRPQPAPAPAPVPRMPTQATQGYVSRVPARGAYIAPKPVARTAPAPKPAAKPAPKPTTKPVVKAAPKQIKR
jgi:hypothetical protein